jgi:DDE superfamily endonuclease
MDVDENGSGLAIVTSPDPGDASQRRAPTFRDLRPGQTKVMDNLSAHKGGRVKEIVEGRGCEILYLPSYSPDLNPIEQAFSMLREGRSWSMCRLQENTRR